MTKEQEKLLRKELCELFPQEQTARNIVENAGIQPHLISFSNQTINTWISVIKHAKFQSKIPNLIESALEFTESKTLNGLQKEIVIQAKDGTPEKEPEKSTSSSQLYEIRHLMKRGKTKGAIEALNLWVSQTFGEKSEEMDTFILIKGRHLRNQINRDKGIMTLEDNEMESQKIDEALLNFLNRLEE